MKLRYLFSILAALLLPVSFAVATPYTGPSTSADVQLAIDALPPAGGVLVLPCGSFPGDPIVLRDNVTLSGTGPCTVIPRTYGNGSPRNYGMGLQDLIVDGAITTTPGYCIDWRNVTTSRISRVTTRGCSLGLLLMGTAYYNVIDQLFANATTTAVEIYGGANQNTIIGGKFSAPTGLNVISVNGTVVLGTALEDAIYNMTFKVVTGDGGSTRAVGVRMEDLNHSSTYWNQ